LPTLVADNSDLAFGRGDSGDLAVLRGWRLHGLTRDLGPPERVNTAPLVATGSHDP
jgi:hypothetical protein